MESSKNQDCLIASKGETEEMRELKLILNGIPFGIFWKDSEFVYKGGNESFKLMSNVENCQLIGKTDFDLHTNETAHFFRREDKAILAGLCDRNHFYDRLVTFKNNEEKWIRTYKMPVFSEEADPKYILGVIQDVTEIKQSEIALAESEGRLRTILDATNDHVFFLNLSGRILDCNVAFLNYHSLTKEQTRQKYFGELIPPTLFNRFMEHVQLACMTGMPTSFELAPEQNPFATYFGVSIYPVAVEGRNTAAVIFAKDITETKQNELKLLNQQEQLLNAIGEAESANRAKSEFLSRMSHEIRTPLNAIIGMARIAASTDDAAKIRSCLKKIDISSKQLLNVINDVLDMSKIEADKLVLSEDVFRLENMLIEVTNIISVRADEKKQDFEVIIDQTLPEYFLADELRLSQVLTNLLSNAVKFTPEYGSIRLNIKNRGLKNGFVNVEIAVSDTGIGLSSEQIERLFRPFEQADGGITRKYGGSGLGLAICKRIIEKMGGAITVTSVQGMGSCFTVNCLLRPHFKTGTCASKKMNLDDIRALIVDDSSETLEYLSHILNDFGIRHDLSSSGLETIDLISRATKQGDPYNVIFIDWAMPGMDGIETTRRIREIIDKNTIIIMISVFDWERIEKEANSAGVNKFLPKPIFPSALRSVLGEIACLEQRHDDVKKLVVPVLDGKKILVAEDIEINREIAAALLEPTGAAIDYAINGKEAIAKFCACKEGYDIILMDIHMPEMDGFEAARIIRGSSSVPIIAMTADAFKEDIEKCKAAGMNDHIAKPIDEQDLYKKLTKLT